MSPELITAVKERIERGYTNEAIRTELLAAGYTETVITQVLALARPPLPVAEADGVSAVPLVSIEAPSVLTMVNEGFKFSLKRFDLIGALIVGPVVMLVLTYLTAESATINQSMLMNHFFIVLGTSLWNIFAYCATIYVITKNAERQVPFGEALAWATKNVWSFIWVSILMTLVVYGGMILFFVPAIILSILVGFSHYVFVKEGLKGMNALLRSRELVRGRWWAVATKLLGVMVVFFGLFIGVTILSGILLAASAASESLTLILPILTLTLVSVAIIVNMFVGAQIYHWLANTRPQAYLPPPDKWKYTALAWLGFLLPGLLIVSTIVLASLNNARQMGREASIKQQLNQTKAMAEIYYNQNNDSYAGVCPELEAVVTAEGFKNCIDDYDGWALAFTPRSESMQLPWCIDNSSDVGRSVLDIANVACASTPPNFENRADTKQRLQEFDTVTDY